MLSGTWAEADKGQPSADRMFVKAMEFDADGDGKLNKDELQKFIADFLTRPKTLIGPERPRRPWRA